MRRIIQQKYSVFTKLVRILFWAAIVTYILSGYSGALEPPSIPPNLNASEKEFVQVAQLYSTQSPAGFPKELTKAGGSEHVAISMEQTRQILLLGGLLVFVGTFFIPYMLPQLTGYHEKITHFLEQTVRTYKTMFHLSIPRFGSPARTRLMASALQQPVVRPRRPDPRVAAYPPLRGSNVPSPVNRLPIRNNSPTGMIGGFFQQSGFTLTEVSDFELRVTSQLSRYRCYGEIPVYIMNNTILTKQHIHHIYARIHAQTSPASAKGNGRMAFVIVTNPPDESAYHQLYAYRLKHNVTIIPLSTMLVAKSVRHASCAQQLEEKISAFTGQCNLYAMNTPVADPLSFFGRSEIMTRIVKAVEQHKTIGIFGLPKIGKTWLLWQLKEQFANYVSIYIDARQLPKSCSYLYRKIIDESVRDVGFKYPDLKLPRLKLSWAGSSENDAQEFQHDLLTLWKSLKSKGTAPRLLLLLDGAEQLLPNTAEDSMGCTGFQEFLSTLQQISQQHGFLTTIMSFGSLTPVRGQVMQKIQLEKRICLTSLSEEGCNQMISILGAKMGLRYSEEALSNLYYQTGGHPYVTRQVCSLIAKNLRRSKIIPTEQQGTTDETTVQVCDVEQAVSEYLEYKSEYLDNLWRQLSPVKQNIFRAIATGESCTLAQLIAPKLTQHVRDARQQAINRLEEQDLIERCEEKYSVKMGLLKQLIAAKA